MATDDRQTSTTKPRGTVTCARPELKERLIALFGAKQGYSEWVEDEIEKLTGKRFGRAYINGIIGGRDRASVPMQLALVRVVKQQPELTNVEAAAFVPDWFETREVGKR